MSTQRITKKRKRQPETCIQCRTSRKQCDKGHPCRNCADNNRKCLYAKEFPYSELSQERQAAILERLLYDARGKYEQLKKYLSTQGLQDKDWQAQVVMANNKRLLMGNIQMEANMMDAIRRQTAHRIAVQTSTMHQRPATSPDTTFAARTEWPVNEQVFLNGFERNSRLMALLDGLHRETAPPLPRMLDASSSDFSIDLARAMVTVEEVDMLIALYNDCYSFSALPEFITPHLEEAGDYDLLLSSVMALMLSHAVNLHNMKVDNHEHLSHAFYHYSRELLEKRLLSLPLPDIMSLHATFNLMLYEAENGYLDQAVQSRQSMAVMIDTLHHQYPSMSVWQQNLLRHLLWAIFTADASRHNLQMQQHVITSSYMDVEKQRPSEHCAQPVDRLKEEYIYFRCRLAEIVRQIDDICYKPSKCTSTPPQDPASTSPSARRPSSSVSGQDIKMLEEQLWSLYYDLPEWITAGQPLQQVDLSKYPGYFGHPDTRPSADPCVHNRAHPVCKRTLDEVWMRRLHYHFLVEWHGTFLYLYQPFLPQPGEIIQLPFLRCVEHGRQMVDVLTRWADDPDFFDCYCYPALRSLMVASHVHRYLLQSQFDDIRNKGYELLFNLYSVIQRSNIYNLYKDTAFILNIRAAFDRLHHDYAHTAANVFGAPPSFLPFDPNASDDVFIYTATAT
ncbi:hypothetical protein DM01DRAFT_1409616 [Hesseltinella vesiculosa]|uniref:Zn(2)-C6 fungal-type domain-containing protein n=1 Tax=Hesseltinella vesiculosa TaxID=101127 RepID=A0A1X2GAM1_9FUNG|nr:hypothetical protein DM01DRAFT_1409616 [Hesseltinella vesiculosa]